MYEFIKGIACNVVENAVVVSVCGIGYKIKVSKKCVNQLLYNEEVTLFVTLVVKESSRELYGFLLKEERDAFEILMKASGVGPKIALSIFDIFTIEAVVEIFRCNLVEKLQVVPGIGEKTAKKVLIEVKDKMSTISCINLKTTASMENAVIADAMSALMNLGFAKNDAENAVVDAFRNGGKEFSLSELISKALKVLSASVYR